MRIRHLTLTLPPRMTGTAQHDARRLAETLAQALHAEGATTGLRLTIPGNALPAAHLQTPLTHAVRTALAKPKGR